MCSYSFVNHYKNTPRGGDYLRKGTSLMAWGGSMKEPCVHAWDLRDEVPGNIKHTCSELARNKHGTKSSSFPHLCRALGLLWADALLQRDLDLPGFLRIPHSQHQNLCPGVTRFADCCFLVRTRTELFYKANSLWFHVTLIHLMSLFTFLM